MSQLIKKVVFPNFPELPTIPEIIDGLESVAGDKTLSAKQGSVLKGLIDDLPDFPVIPVVKAGYDNQTPPDLGLFNAAHLPVFIPYGYKRHVAFGSDFAEIPQVNIAQGISDKIYVENVTVSGFDLVAYSIDLVGEFGNQQAYVNESITWLAIGH